MSFRSQLPDLTRFTFGTGKVDQPDDSQHMRVTRMAMDAGVWFHSSHVYGDGRVFQTLKKVFKEDPGHIPKCIFKVDGMGADLLRDTVQASIEGTGVERVDIAQVCGNPDPSTLIPGAALHDTMMDLKQKGLVASYVLEIFWRGSTNAMQALKGDLFDGYIFYYNVVNREVNNELFDLLHQKQANILSLRTVGGGVENFNDPGDPVAVRKALDDIYQRSGCTSPLEFRTRFVLSDPLVRTTIGATSKPDHLTALMHAVRDAKPLPRAIVDEISALHRTWFSSKGIW